MMAPNVQDWLLAVGRDKRLAGNPEKVARALAKLLTERDGAPLKLAELVAESGVTQRHVTDCIHVLCIIGWVHKEVTRGPAGNRYELRVPE